MPFGKRTHPVPDWENPQVQRVGTQPPRANFFVHPSRALALDSEWSASPWVLSLNGFWKFHWGRDPDHRPGEFYRPHYEATHWEEIKVPGNWQLQGFGVPMYLNRAYPFQKEPPRVTAEPPTHYTSFKHRNPVGSYRRTFRVPPDWTGQRVCLHFGGVDNCFYAWLNGQALGFVKDSRTPSEFDVTEALQAGDNLLAVQVYQFSDASYLEGQDKWRLSGIFRDVYLWCAPATYVRDAEVRPGLDAVARDGFLSTFVTVHNAGKELVSAELTSELLSTTDGTTVARGDRQALLSAGEEKVLEWSVQVPNALRWSPEEPFLYTLLLTLQTDGPAQYVGLSVGFRRVEIVERQLRVNGQPVTIRGVNRNEFSPETGFYVSPELMERDIVLMKRNNINAVRTSHYANAPLWYDLCDRYGLYVVAETNLEAHDMGAYTEHALVSDPLWKEAVVGRHRRTVELCKNHPSVVLWSLGNEAGNGPHLRTAYAWIKQRDPSRPVQYESALRANNTDVYCPMYTRIWDLEAYANDPTADRPLILCEYAHAMGNALGNFKDYWETIAKYPVLQGGFIWEWCDLAVAAAEAGANARFFRYGGDFGEQPHDGNFCCDGLVQPDRLPNPSLAEAKKVYEPVSVEAGRHGRLRISNRYTYRNLDHLECRWELSVNGIPHQKGVLSLPTIAPGETAEVTNPVAHHWTGAGEGILMLSFCLRDAALWAEKGYEVAWAQVSLAPALDQSLKPPRSDRAQPPALEVTAEFYRVHDEDLVVEVNQYDGLLWRFEVRGKSYLLEPLRPNFWRTLNDSLMRMAYKPIYSLWKSAGPVVTHTYAEFHDGVPAIRAQLRVGDLADWEFAYRFLGSRKLEVRMNFHPLRPHLAPLPRLGLRTRLPGDLRRVRWFGRGPHETYYDRKESGRIGIYQATLSELHFPYVHPQLNGNRTEVRWLELVDAEGRGLRFRAISEPLQFTAHDYGDAELEAARHDAEIVRGGFVELQLDHRQMGVGGDNAWGADVLPKYQIPAADYRFSWVVEPIEAAV